MTPASSRTACAAALAILLFSAAASPETTWRLTGSVTHSSGKHTVFVALWSAQGFLEHPVQTARFAPGATPVFSFHVPPGRWALSAFEDTNENGVLDMGMFGPKEPAGFWRRFTGWHRPKFDEVASPVDRDVDHADIELR